MALSKSELFHCFRRGWRHGALSSAQDPRFVEHQKAGVVEAYRRGYDKGRAAAILASADEADRIGYDPRMSILRGEPPIDPPDPD